MNYIATLEIESNSQLLANSINNGKIIFAILTFSFIVISLVIMLFASKIIINPITKLIKNAKKIAEGEDVEEEIKSLENSKSKTEIDELVKAFNLMTFGLKENLNEVTRQKNQIETILLHMTDGIIAFNIDRKYYTHKSSSK